MKSFLPPGILLWLMNCVLQMYFYTFYRLNTTDETEKMADMKQEIDEDQNDSFWVRLRGLPWNTKKEEIVEFLGGKYFDLCLRSNLI